MGGGPRFALKGAQKAVSLAQADEVSGDRALGAVLGAQVPLE